MVLDDRRRQAGARSVLRLAGTAGSILAMPALLRPTDSLDSLWEELVYTEARLLAADHKPEAAAVGKALKTLSGLQAGQKEAWRREIVAQAHVDASDDDLDEEVETVARDLLYIEKGNRKSARFRQYFKGPVATIVRLGLKSQLDVVRPFVALLAKEAEKVLKDHGKTLATILKKGDAAVEERATAATDRANHRARHILSFVDDVNAMRTSMHAELTLFAAKKRLPRDYADRFFRRTSRTSKGLEPAPEPVPSPEE